jgi:ABC-type multidrug transport system fused ATPase/permease subunit
VLDVSPHPPLFYSCIFLYVTFFVSLVRFTKIRKVVIDYLKDYVKDDEADNLKNVSKENLFVAFHDVHFQLPTILTDSPIFDNLSFSVLPGEFVAITGENIQYSEFVFDLILKYYKPQSGNIYISGTPLPNISTPSIRSKIGFFKEDFALAQGTVYDNLSVISNDKKKIVDVSKKIQLYEDLNVNILDENNYVQVPQDLLFRLQIGRLSIQKPKILLIETPEAFESQNEEYLFNDFVRHSSKKKTTIISTSNPEFIIYANKILYIGDGKIEFGTHAELSKNSEYQRYIAGFTIIS